MDNEADLKAILPIYNYSPAAEEPKPVVPTSKVGQIIEKCSGDGAKASELLPLFVKRNGEPWLRDSISRRFRYDLPRVHGYGVRTISDRDGIDHTYVVYAGSVDAPGMPRHLNTIIYGPPGTGKTYATVRRCVETCDGSAEGSDREIRQRYDALVKADRIEFITFHQSYGYEEFVEGLRPVMASAETDKGTRSARRTDGDARSPESSVAGAGAARGSGFRLVAVPGVLRRIAERARETPHEAHVLVIDEINRSSTRAPTLGSWQEAPHHRRMPATRNRPADMARASQEWEALREWETLPIGNAGLPEHDARPLHAAAERAARHLRLPETAVLTRTYQGLKAGQVVGVLSIPGCTIEVLPKIDREDGAVRAALIRMLAVAWDLRVAEGELTALDTQRDDLLELLIRLFADRLLAAVRRGMPRRYVTHEEDLALLRGRLEVKRQFTHLVVRPDRLACRYDELSEDTPLNQVLKAAVTRLAGRARSTANFRRLAELTARFEFVRDSSDPLREPVRLDRTNATFHELYRLARLFLSGDWQSTAGGRSTGFALLFPMNELFEAFIGRSLKRALALRTVHLQNRRRSALTGANGEPLFALQPDAVMEDSGDRPVILDTKWKRLTPRARGCKTTLGVAQSDIYQMLAYARAYDARRLVLIYPWHEELEPEQGVIRRWTVTGTDCRLDVATVDVGCPDEVVETLRGICEYEPVCGRPDRSSLHGRPRITELRDAIGQ